MKETNTERLSMKRGNTSIKMIMKTSIKRRNMGTSTETERTSMMKEIVIEMKETDTEMRDMNPQGMVVRTDTGRTSTEMTEGKEEIDIRRIEDTRRKEGQEAGLEIAIVADMRRKKDQEKRIDL